MARTKNALTGVQRSAPISVQISRQIVSAIQTGQFPVGGRLPSEQMLADHFGVSRASIREALSALQFAGYVESRRGAGSVVVADHPWEGTGARQEPLGADGAAHLLEARLVIEPRTLYLAALDPHPAALKEAARLLEGMEVSLEQPELDARTDLSLHIAFARVCRNQFLVDASTQLLRKMGESPWRPVSEHAWSDPALLEAWLEHHHHIFDALDRREPEQAADIARRHLLSAARNAVATPRLAARHRAGLNRVLERYADEPVTGRR